MKTLVHAAIAIMLGLIPAAVDAANWQQYFENKAGTKFYIDQASHIRLPNGHVQAWRKQEKNPGDGFLYLIEVNCAERKYATKNISPDKKTIENMNTAALMISLNSGWEDFEPNDLDEETLAVWCKLK